MKAWIIALEESPYSLSVARRCFESCIEHSIAAEIVWGVSAERARSVMEDSGLEWTWANNNESPATCPHTGLAQHPYRTRDLNARIGCAMSHYLLWKGCADGDEPYLILEHDSVVVRPFPMGWLEKIDGICMVNDPAGCTPRGKWWSEQMHRRGPGVFEKTWVRSEAERKIPDGLAGNSAYVVQPWAARELVDTVGRLGVWPNDATMCKQLFPYLQEMYPFVTKVVSTHSTTSD